MIEINELKNSQYYRGYCVGNRGPHVMQWNQGKFLYMRNKFGTWFVDEMHHENDPNRAQGIEGFVPLEEIIKMDRRDQLEDIDRREKSKDNT